MEKFSNQEIRTAYESLDKTNYQTRSQIAETIQPEINRTNELLISVLNGIAKVQETNGNFVYLNKTRASKHKESVSINDSKFESEIVVLPKKRYLYWGNSNNLEIYETDPTYDKQGDPESKMFLGFEENRIYDKFKPIKQNLSNPADKVFPDLNYYTVDRLIEQYSESDNLALLIKQFRESRENTEQNYVTQLDVKSNQIKDRIAQVVDSIARSGMRLPNFITLQMHDLRWKENKDIMFKPKKMELVYVSLLPSLHRFKAMPNILETSPAEPRFWFVVADNLSILLNPKR